MQYHRRGGSDPPIRNLGCRVCKRSMTDGGDDLPVVITADELQAHLLLATASQEHIVSSSLNVFPCAWRFQHGAAPVI